MGISSLYSSINYCSYDNSSIPDSLFISISLTAGLNLILGAIIAYRLYRARSAVLQYPHGRTIGAWYIRLVAFIVESALLWIIASVLCVVTVVTNSRTQPFFELLFEITTVSHNVLLRNWETY
jgi:hypothetical protein